MPVRGCWLYNGEPRTRQFSNHCLLRHAQRCNEGRLEINLC
uniref:Uncharacterized protein n=1 Tax=Ciona intestinalis TaxID=7719 RepID=H2XJJ1_CIOIN